MTRQTTHSETTLVEDIVQFISIHRAVKNDIVLNSILVYVSLETRCTTGTKHFRIPYSTYNMEIDLSLGFLLVILSQSMNETVKPVPCMHLSNSDNMYLIQRVVNRLMQRYDIQINTIADVDGLLAKDFLGI